MRRTLLVSAPILLPPSILTQAKSRYTHFMPSYSTSSTLATDALPTAVELAQLAQTGDDDGWSKAFVSLADHLLLTDPPALLRLVQDAANYSLPGTQSHLQLAYFTPLALRKNNQLDKAITQFTALLARPDLPLELRARTLNSRAVGYRLQGQLALAQEGYTTSLALWRELGDTLNVGKVQLNRGIIAYQLRRFAEAEQFLQEAAACFTAVGATSWLAGVTNELGLLHRDQGRLDDALVQFDRFLAQRQAEGAREQIGLAQLNRGEILLFQGNLEEAQVTLRAALDALHSSPYCVDAYLGLGLTTAVQGELTTALTLFQQAQQTTYALGRSEILPHVYYHLADVCQRLGQLERARHYLETAVVVIEQNQSERLDESVSISLLGRWQQVYEALFLVQMALGETEAAFITAERARARAFAQRLTDSLSQNWVTIGGVQSDLTDETTLLSYFATGVIEHDLPLLRQLPPDSPVREHLLVTPHIYRFVITSDSIAATDCRFNPNLLTSNSPRGADPRRFVDERVQDTLRQTLWPAELNTPHVIVIPHGPLHQVPFRLLADEQTALTLTPSATIWHDSQTQPSKKRKGTHTAVVLAYAGDGQLAPPLQFVTAEAQAVAARLQGQVVQEITPDQFSQADVVHFACHSWFNLVHPLDSYLELGPQPEQQLTAQHIMDNWTLTARLVTLSACQTGLSRVLRGDEPLGLVRAFLAAGAEAVLVTQWPVDDWATFLLMRRFYGLLAEKPEQALARTLAQAQAWLRALKQEAAIQLAEEMDVIGKIPSTQIENDTRPFATPSFWAGFILVSQ